MAEWVTPHAFEDESIRVKYQVPWVLGVGNACVDALAGRGAQVAAVPLEEVWQAKKVCARLQRVQRRLLAILRFVVHECPRVIERVDKPPLEVDGFSLEVLRSRHVPVAHSGGVNCSVCHEGATGSQVDQVLFLSQSLLGSACGVRVCWP